MPLALQSFLYVGRQREGAMMYGGGVVQGLERTGGGIGFAEAIEGLLAGHGAAPPAGGVDRLREVQGLGGVETGLAHVAVDVFEQFQVQQRGFALLYQDAVVGQGAHAVAEEGFTEQAFNGFRQADAAARPFKTLYYSPEVHQGALALPPYVQEALQV